MRGLYACRAYKLACTGCLSNQSFQAFTLKVKRFASANWHSSTFHPTRIASHVYRGGSDSACRGPIAPSACSSSRCICVAAGPVGILHPETWAEHAFVRVAEESLECISEKVSQLDVDSKDALDDFDVELSQGVLTISLGSEGTYVLNTQTPNRQIWMSSPSSGPWRYAWKTDEQQWVSTRDGHPLSSRLTEELSGIFGKDVLITFDNVFFFRD